MTIDNEPHLLRQVLGLAKQSRNAAPSMQQVHDQLWTIRQAAMFDLAPKLRRFVETRTTDKLDKPHMTVAERLMLAMVESAVCDVNWNNVASHYLQKVAEGASVPSE